MEKKIFLRYSYKESHGALDDIDAWFYDSLPERKEEHLNSKTGRPEAPRDDLEQILTIVGSTFLSSTVIATAIKAWLKSRRCKITISIDGSTKKVEYEGPNIKQNVTAIQTLIDNLAEEAGESSLRITATLLPPKNPEKP